jgi:tetratricopeptide (TPR) repeat protein
MQEAAYQTILRRHRREFHRRVGEALEVLFPDQLDQYGPALGFHFAEAGDAQRALKYTTLAGDAAYRLYANAEAIGHYTRALELAQRHGAPGEVFRHLYQRRGRALELNTQYKEALDNYAALEALGQQRDEPALVLAGVMGQGVIHAMGTTTYADPERAAAALERALSLAESLGDHAVQARIHWARMQQRSWSLDMASAAAEGERSLALAREYGLTEQRAYTLTDLGILYFATFGLRRSSELLDEAVPLWRQLNNQPLLANSLSFVATLRTHAGEVEQAIAASDEAYELTASIRNWWGMAFSRMTVGLAYWDRGEAGQAIALLQDALRNAERAGFNVPLFSSNAFLAAIYGSLGAEAQARAVLAQVPQQPAMLVKSFRPLHAALEIALPLDAGDLGRAAAAAEVAGPALEGEQSYYMRGSGNFLMGLLGSIRCQLALAHGQPDEGLRSAEQFLALAREVQEGRDLPELLYWRGQALQALGQIEAARASLEEARALAQPAPLRRILWRIDLALAELEAQAGRTSEAAALRRSARDHITYIADHAGSPELRASFLARAAVQAALDQG